MLPSTLAFFFSLSILHVLSALNPADLPPGGFATNALPQDTANVDCINDFGGNIAYGPCVAECNAPDNCQSTSMTATLTKTLVANAVNCGKEAYGNPAKSPGQGEIQEQFGNEAATRGHLLARSLGGSGYDMRNIVTLWQRANSPTHAFWEGKIRNTMRHPDFPNNGIIEYKVRALYDPCLIEPAPPRGLWLETRYSENAGAIEDTHFTNWFKVWIVNKFESRSYILFDYSDQPPFNAFQGGAPVARQESDLPPLDLGQKIPYDQATRKGERAPMPPDVYPEDASTDISCSLSCLPKETPSPSSSPSSNATPTPTATPTPAPDTSPVPSPDPEPQSNESQSGGLIFGISGFIAGLFFPFFGDECVKEAFPVQLLKESGYTSCRFCTSAQYPGYAVCTSISGGTEQLINARKVLEDDHGWIQCDLAALKRNGADISLCEQSNLNSCAVDCAECKAPVARKVQLGQQYTNSYKNFTFRQNSLCDQGVCCASSCGICGGSGCGSRPGGSTQCCKSKIIDSGIVCGTAPCILSDSQEEDPVSSGGDSATEGGSSSGSEIDGICTGDICCPTSCGTCGGSGCGSRPGGATQCCKSKFIDAGKICGTPPCILDESQNVPAVDNDPPLGEDPSDGTSTETPTQGETSPIPSDPQVPGIQINPAPTMTVTGFDEVC